MHTLITLRFLQILQPEGSINSPTQELVDQSISMAPVKYVMSRGIATVQDAWREWKNGLGGNLSIEELERRYKAKWRPSATDRQFFSRWKTLIEKIKEMSREEKLAEDVVIDRLEKLRLDGGKSLDAFQKQIIKDKRAKKA